MGKVTRRIQLLEQQIKLLTGLLREKDHKIDRLEHRLDLLLRKRFGRSSEKLPSGQGELFDFAVESKDPTEESASEEEAAEEDSSPRRRSRHKGRQKLPADLPRRRIEIHPDPKDCVCEYCNDSMSPIGEHVSERLDYEPASFFLVETARIKYACKTCQIGVVSSDLPAEPIEKGLPGPGLLAHVLTSKYCDHLPLYRQEAIFARAGIPLSRKTLCGWVGAMAGLLEPIVRRLRESILASDVIQSDDTTIRVLDPEATGASWRGLAEHGPQRGEGERRAHPIALPDRALDQGLECRRALLRSSRALLARARSVAQASSRARVPAQVPVRHGDPIHSRKVEGAPALCVRRPTGDR